MKVQGTEVLLRHFPDLRTSHGRVRIGVYAMIWPGLVSLYFILSDQIPAWSIDSQILIAGIGYLILRQFFARKNGYIQKYGDLAYRMASIHFAIPGLGFIFAAVAHTGYMNGPAVPRGWWTVAFEAAGWWTLVTGAGLWIRSILTLGVDHLAMVHVYYPAGGRMVDALVYGVLRHPVYAGVLRVVIGLALLNGNANALAFIPFMLLGSTGWVRLVEERELIERFGSGYLEYRSKVPAFWPRVKDIPMYIGFLLKGR
jgi:protein-S-isoprenylcysteine O-methyltransferase Ste14